MKIVKIKAKMSGTGSIHDIESDQYDRVIKFPDGHQYAVVPAAYYGDQYTTHVTEGEAIDRAEEVSSYSLSIIGSDGHVYLAHYDRLVRDTYPPVGEVEEV